MNKLILFSKMTKKKNGKWHDQKKMVNDIRWIKLKNKKSFYKKKKVFIKRKKQPKIHFNIIKYSKKHNSSHLECAWVSSLNPTIRTVWIIKHNKKQVMKSYEARGERETKLKEKNQILKRMNLE